MMTPSLNHFHRFHLCVWGLPYIVDGASRCQAPESSSCTGHWDEFSSSGCQGLRSYAQRKIATCQNLGCSKVQEIIFMGRSRNFPTTFLQWQMFLFEDLLKCNILRYTWTCEGHHRKLALIPGRSTMIWLNRQQRQRLELDPHFSGITNYWIENNQLNFSRGLSIEPEKTGKHQLFVLCGMVFRCPLQSFGRRAFRRVFFQDWGGTGPARYARLPGNDEKWHYRVLRVWPHETAQGRKKMGHFCDLIWIEWVCIRDSTDAVMPGGNDEAHQPGGMGKDHKRGSVRAKNAPCECT